MKKTQSHNLRHAEMYMALITVISLSTITQVIQLIFMWMDLSGEQLPPMIKKLRGQSPETHAYTPKQFLMTAHISTGARLLPTQVMSIHGD